MYLLPPPGPPQQRQPRSTSNFQPLPHPTRSHRAQEPPRRAEPAFFGRDEGPRPLRAHGRLRLDGALREAFRLRAPARHVAGNCAGVRAHVGGGRLFRGLGAPIRSSRRCSCSRIETASTAIKLCPAKRRSCTVSIQGSVYERKRAQRGLRDAAPVAEKQLEERVAVGS